MLPLFAHTTLFKKKHNMASFYCFFSTEHKSRYHLMNVLFIINAIPQILTCRPLFISTEGVTAYGQPDRITYHFKNKIYIF